MRANAVVLLLAAGVAAQPAVESVEVVRDSWGVPHVFASSDAGAMYGLGYATAEDRLFQMYYGLRVMQGRLAETIGNRRRRNNKGDAVLSDRKMRTFGWWRWARRVAARLDPDTRRLLRAYSRGVNDWVAQHELPEPFGRYGVEPEPWSPAASLVSWAHLAQFFGTDGSRDLIAWRNLKNPRRPRPPRIAPDDSVAVVRRGDVSDAWVGRVEAFVRAHGLDKAKEPSQPGKKFSHAWVVGGAKTTTGRAVLCSDPQTPVTNPSLLYEFHVKGATFDARGAGVAGSPIILIGFNRDVAWGMTARGADQADLWRLVTDAAHRDSYRLDGTWTKMDVRRETIRVRGGAPKELVVRGTVFGPVLSEFAFVRGADPAVAVQRVPLVDTDVDTVQGGIAMMRASDVRAFAKALHGWRFPSANCLYGDSKGDIGYMTIGAMPLRSAQSASSGRYAHDGSSRKNAWQGFVPGDLMPQIINPQRGYILSGNHRPIASFYRIPIGPATGSSGESLRSWRLRELLTAKKQFTPEDVLAVHRDTTNAALREIVRIGLHLRDATHLELDPPAARALEVLDDWFEDGARSDLRRPGAALATLIPTGFRAYATPLTATYGGGQSGLARLLKQTRAKLEGHPEVLVHELEWEWAERVLDTAWRNAVQRYGPDPRLWDARARAAVERRKLGWFAGLDGFPSLDPAKDLPVPALYCVDGNTIQSQAAQAYSQWVPAGDTDRALSLCPPGQSERPGSPTRRINEKLWAKGDLHPAPLSRKAVDAISRSVTRLAFVAR